MTASQRALAAAFAVLLGACSAPISVERANPRDVHRALTETVLSTGKLSATTRNLLRRANLLDLYEREPEVALEAGHQMLLERAANTRRSRLVRDAGVALAEASFQHASRSGDRRYFLGAAIYAWLYLFSEVPLENHIDPRLRLAADLYNRALTLSILDDRTDLEPKAGLAELPFGVLDVRFDEQELQWGARRFTGFAPVSDLKVRGMRNRYRDPGLGAPFAASTDSPTGRHADSDRVVDAVRVPVAVLLEFDDLSADLPTGTIRAQMTIHPGSSNETEIEGRSVPLEMERTSTLALMLTEAAPWRREIRGFFQGDLAMDERGLLSLAPHQPGRIPVILVHGTASSTATWANLLNDLNAEAELRSAYEFWLFTYNTGAPIAYSGWLLRKAIDEMVETLDPEGVDPFLRRAVVIGHSQGGLLSKLMTVDSGDVFWSQIFDRPPEDLKVSEESLAILEGSLFVKPHPAVERVVFIATPHRGSFLASYSIAKWMGKFVRAPANLAQVVGELATSDPDAAAMRKIDDVDSALGNMSPGSPFLEELVAMPVSPGIGAHSIIGMKKLEWPKEEGSDGVVEYESAHLDGVESEVVVESGHSSLAHPEVVGEVRRILLMHLLSTRYAPRMQQ